MRSVICGLSSAPAKALFLSMCCASALLTGCGPAIYIAPDPVVQAPAANESPVGISVTGNTAVLSAPTGIHAYLVKKYESGERAREYVLHSVGPKTETETAAYVGTLPEGEYLIDCYDFGPTAFVRMGEASQNLLGKFVVKGGEPVDLGRLVFASSPDGRRTLLGRSSMVTDNQKFLSRLDGRYAALFTTSATGWLGPVSEYDIAESISLSAPIGSRSVTPEAPGHALVATRMGSVLERTTGGRWQVWRTRNSLESLYDVMPADRQDARFIAVGEYSTIVRMPRDGQQMEPVSPGNLPVGKLLFIAGNDKVGWYVLDQSGDDVRLFHSATIEAGDWTQIATESTAFSRWNGLNTLWAWRTRNGMAYAVSAGKIHFLDFETGQWTHREAPNRDRLIQVAPNADGSIGALTSPGGGAGGVLAGVWLSHDNAESWQALSVPFTVKVAAPVATPEGRLIVAGGAFGNPELQISDDHGATWSKLADHSLDRSIQVTPDGLFYAITSGFGGQYAIRTSEDGGVHWRIEYTNAP